MTRLYILSPSRPGAVPKEYFGYDAQTGAIDFHKQVMVDRYKAYEFLKCLLALAYCWSHVRRNFIEASRDDKDCQWAYLEACARHGSKAPADVTRWLPWNFVPPEIPAARNLPQDLPQGGRPRGPAP